MGFPKTDVQTGSSPDFLLSRFERGAILGAPATGGAFEVSGSIYAHYMLLGGDGGILGLPLSGEENIASGRKCKFQNGNIYWSQNSGAFEVSGEILARYVALGETDGPLGFPTSGVSDVLDRDGHKTGGLLCNFQNGSVYWSQGTGAFAVMSDILVCYLSNGGPLGYLGYPVCNEEWIPNAAPSTGNTSNRYCDFQNGIIVWRPGKGAMAITELDLYLEKVTSGPIDDGVGDKSAELVCYTTVIANGVPLESEWRRPHEHASDSYFFDVHYPIKPVHKNTVIYLKVKYDDWDQDSSNDYLGTIEKYLNISTIWGIDENLGGIFNTPLTDRTNANDCPSLDTIITTFRIGPPSHVDPDRPFREQCWWPFHNFDTDELSRDCYASTFTNVDVTDGDVFDRFFLHPIDALYYELFYKHMAKHGHCFGMCVAAQYAIHGRSIFALPLIQYDIGTFDQQPDSQVPESIVDHMHWKHGYQLGAAVIGWTMSRIASLDVLKPLNVYDRVKSHLQAYGTSDPIILTFINLTGGGHSVLGYDFRDGTGDLPRRIYVADPNHPFGECDRKDASYIEISPDNTFKLLTPNGKVAYESNVFEEVIPTTFMFETPYSVVSSQPRTPIWDIVLDLQELLGGVLLFSGDAETDQITSGSQEFYGYHDGKKCIKPNNIPGMARISMIPSTPGDAELYVMRGKVPGMLKLDLHGIKNGSYTHYFRTAKNLISVECPMTDGTRDSISISGTDTSAPLVALATDGPVKSAAVRYSVIEDAHGRNKRIFSLDLQASGNEPAYAGVEPRGGNLVVKPSGPPKPFSVSMETIVNNKARTAMVRIVPETTGEMFRVKPIDFAMQGHGSFLVEQISSKDGRLTRREHIIAENK